MTESLFQEYAELKVKEREVEERLNELKPQVIEEMKGAGLDKQPTPLGNFTIQMSKKWKFSAEVNEAESRVKKLKEQEKADGIAECTEVPELKFFHAKPLLEEDL